MVRSVLLLAIAGLATADQTLRSMSGLKAAGKMPNLGVTLSAAAACGLAEQECDGGCIPIGAECCGTGDGGYCAVGDYCDNGGCCEIGSICTGEPTGCGDDQEACGDRCMPEGAVCCSGLGYCDAGETCDSGGCLTGGGDSSGGDDDDDSSSGGGGDSSGPVCDSSQEECGDGCMPLGSVCCGNSQYCPANYACAANDRCTPSLSGGGSDDDDSDDDDSDVSIPPIPSFTVPTAPTYTLAPVPTITGPFSGDDSSDDGDSSSSSDNDNNSSNGNDGESQGSDNDPSNANMVLPSLLASLMVLVPLLL